MSTTDSTSTPDSSLDATVREAVNNLSALGIPGLPSPAASLPSRPAQQAHQTSRLPLPSHPAPSEPAFGDSDEDWGNLLPTDDDDASPDSNEDLSELPSTDEETEDETGGAFEERRAFVRSCNEKARKAQRREKLRHGVLLVNSVLAVKADPSLMKRPRRDDERPSKRRRVGEPEEAPRGGAVVGLERGEGRKGCGGAAPLRLRGGCGRRVRSRRMERETAFASC
ncbi:hypothetical protein W97_04749 [Coniosporium apollinis CBS 100218]|uniref:Uncharacterized protein n=1 Tax=Coniosporium apollinis (strain CBS 100218) TaxID=1168221 RepID=R7YV11_CONA1|nr:uncharacterized protein W97_04749 [Coniosporium apollinis CBS 100218]EON65511.1 hypothetical protein W97_04749 [Coniosporium apollinis CBS 100218]